MDNENHDFTSKTSKFGDKMNERGERKWRRRITFYTCIPLLFIQVVISKERERKEKAI
jgi:hypothetical protein